VAVAADAPPGDVNVRRAESAADLALFERIIIDGYPVPELDGLPARLAHRCPHHEHRMTHKLPSSAGEVRCRLW
jgi:hypothetical protein